jgi:hypothetical protein
METFSVLRRCTGLCINTPAPEPSSSTQAASPPNESGPKSQAQAPTLLQSPLEISNIYSGSIGSEEIFVVADIHVVDKHWESVLS